MPLPQDNSRNYSPVGHNKKCVVEGLDSFLKNLEKHFFSKVTIRDCSTDHKSVKLVLELDCNFSLEEMLHHFKLGTWGNFDCKKFSFNKLINVLKESNDFSIEVEEFSFFLQDTAIIINKIYKNSISEQLHNILVKLSTNYHPLMMSLTEVPYEIYIPVFEENVLDNESTLKDIKADNQDAKEYFNYWGVYLDSQDDAYIYDVESKSIIAGHLHMLNR